MASRSFDPVSKTIKAAVLAAAVALFVLLAYTWPSSAFAAECTDTWTGPAEGTWQTATNWSTGKVPTSSDVACIGSGKTAKVTAGANQAAVVQGEGNLLIKEASLELTNASESSSIKTLTLEYEATLKGAATLDVSHELAWSSLSTMSGSGATVLQTGGTGSITASEAKLIGRKLVNEGTLTFTRTLSMSEGATIENKGTFVDNASEVFNIYEVESSKTPVLFANSGTFEKTEGSSEGGVEANFENTGVVNAKTGTLAFRKAGAKPTETLKASGTLKGAISFTGVNITGYSFNGEASTVHLHESTLTMAEGNTSKVGKLTMEYLATINGAGTIELTETFNWLSESTMSGTGKTVLRSGASGTIESASGKLIGRTLLNEGTLTLSRSLGASEGAVLENKGTFNANAEEVFDLYTIEGSLTSPTLVNTGTVQKTTGTGKTQIDISLENRGTINSKAGKLGFEQKGSTATLAAGSVLEGEILFIHPTITGHNFTVPSGTLYLRESTLTLEGTSTTIANLKMDYESVVTGAGNFEVTQSFDWIGQSTLSGSGTTTLQSGTTNKIESANVVYTLANRTLINKGALALEGLSILGESGNALLENVGTFTANSYPYCGCSTTIIESASGSPKIVNRGTFQRTEGTPGAAVTVAFENQGKLIEKSRLEIKNPITVEHTNHFGTHCDCNDPIDVSTGDFSQTQTDFEIGGRGVGLDLTRTYDAQAAATASSPGAFGYGWTNSFNDHLISEESGKKVTAVSADGSTVPFTESGGSFAAPTWSQDTLSGNAETGYTLTLPEQTKYKFSGTGKLEKVTDRNGNEATLAYNGSGQLETITDPAGRKITLTYNGEGLVEKAKDPMGREVKYTYESKNLASVTMPGETEPRWKFKYDGSHRMTTMTDGRGGKLTNEYDSSNRVISQTDPAERIATFEYRPFETTITNKTTGAVTVEKFTSSNEPYSLTRGYGTAVATTETFTYNGEGRMLSSTDGNGHETTYGYDSHGNRTSMVNPDKDETKWTYNERHEVETETTPGGEKTTITRDSHGNPESISRPAPGKTTQTTKYTYTAHGQVETMTNPLSKVWKYEYDNAGDRTAEIDPETDKRTWTYNEDSRVTSTVSPRGNETGAKPAEYTTTYELDAQGRPIKVTDPLGHETKYAYDANGNLESETDPNGHKTKYTYNADNQVTKVEKPKGNTVETEYDGAGQIKSETDGNKHTTTYVRNVLEQPTEITDPLGHKTINEYDAAGNLKASVDPLKRETMYFYDSANQLKEVKYSDGITPTDKYEYNADGYLTHMTDGTGESTFTFDQLDRLTESKDGHGDTAKYEYNLGNQQTKITYPNGKSVTQTFDSAGRFKSVTDWLEHKTTFAYNRDSDLNKITFPTGTSNIDTYAYSHADLMTEAKMTKGEVTLASQVYARNKAGLVETTTSKGLPGAEKTSYTYDENNRLTKAGTASYEYDAANNLTKAPGTTNTYDKASELETGTNLTYTYNELGERTKTTPSVGPATTYGYDQAGNLTSVKRPKEGETAEINDSYAYNGLQLLASRTISGTTSYMTWKSTGALPLVLSDGQSSYIYGPDGLPVEQVSSSETPTYCHHDQVGSTRLLTNASGEATATFSYGAYGSSEGSTGTQKTPLGFAGQYTEADSGLQYLRARYYDPGTGQFMSRDPLVATTRSPYGYAVENPLLYSDPTGKCGFPVGCFEEAGEAVVGAGEAVVNAAESLNNNEVTPGSLTNSDLHGRKNPVTEAAEEGAEKIGCALKFEFEQELKRDEEWLQGFRRRLHQYRHSAECALHILEGTQPQCVGRPFNEPPPVGPEPPDVEE